jgi:hypothetical protein
MIFKSVINLNSLQWNFFNREYENTLKIMDSYEDVKETLMAITEFWST